MLRHVGELEALPELCFGILTMDLNGLKKVNDTEGHLAGDILIQNAAGLLADEFGTEELYRIGGDEFVVIFPDVSEKEFLIRVKTFREGRLEASGISLACGTLWSDNNENMERAFFRADQNMYADKKAFYERRKQ